MRVSLPNAAPHVASTHAFVKVRCARADGIVRSHQPDLATQPAPFLHVPFKSGAKFNSTQLGVCAVPPRKGCPKLRLSFKPPKDLPPASG